MPAQPVVDGRHANTCSQIGSQSHFHKDLAVFLCYNICNEINLHICMTPEPEPSTPNAIKERDPELFKEVQEFRARFEDILLDKLDNILDNPAFRDRGHFLPRDDVKAIAQVIRVLTRDSWTEEHLDQFDTTWRKAMRSDFFAEAFESIRFRIENAVDTARARVLERPGMSGATQGTLW
jgi:hypothetical protein